MSKKIIFILVGIVVAFALLIGGLFISTNNKVISYEEQIYESQSSLNTQELRRVELLTNMVDAIEDYNDYEQTTLSQIVEIRQSVENGDIESAETLIAAMVEAYPELKSNENYKQYMLELANTENMIQSYRENMNIQIKNYNKYIRSFPSSMILNMMGYEKIDVEYLEFNVPTNGHLNLFNK